MKIKIGQYDIPEIKFCDLNKENEIKDEMFLGGRLGIIKLGNQKHRGIIAIDKLHPHTLFDIMLAFSSLDGIDEIINNKKEFKTILQTGIDIQKKIENFKLEKKFKIYPETTKLIYNISSNISNKSAMSLPAFHLHINTFSSYELNKLKIKEINLSEFDKKLEEACVYFKYLFNKRSIGIKKSKKYGLGVGINVITEWKQFCEIDLEKLVFILQEIHFAMLDVANKYYNCFCNYGVSIYKQKKIIILIQPKYGTSIGAAGAMQWKGKVDFSIPQRSSGVFDKETLQRRKRFQDYVLSNF
ncbi:hypothetical protein JF75_03920 [Lactobacillus kimbladii]|uniref:Uncharacterized protein n=2 Tax=Lactobacillus TaxID=1578 RepID=A0A0F4LEU9_9LACO|nr:MULTISPECIES: hypothetical protein [Lactobacillus]KJY57377.1 hypothetical protein JF74_04000 [Lactobacillus melliventris]KJY59357.1 hypothetical protein JF75_03920 [Lactobacillus kimbladii]NUE98441.1 hypothetical protein [Lactobacillus melliventris]PXY83983.1 hypothetical protein DK873_02015 [Lactobacillus melliventris]RMC59313.1 hypothetical protein F5ESL0260_01990 [Lactobacillus sp. ESL0260]